MKLMELLEQGKKATRNEFEIEYVYVKDEYTIVDNEGREYNPNFNALTRNDWYEYEEYKTNFEFKEGCCYSINQCGNVEYSTDKYLVNMIKNFNAFPDKELAEYIQKKQLLERKLMVFSYLNGASEINWASAENDKIFIEADCNDIYGIETSFNSEYNDLFTIYFKDEEVCRKAIELYEEDIREVMEMKIKLGF